MTKVQAVKLCCATQHTITFHPVPDSGIIPAVKASIAYCDIAAERFPFSRGPRFAAAANRLRDFATVELLCEGLGITRKELK